MESFFQNGSSLDLIEVEELLLHYPNFDYMMNLEINEGILIINKTIQKREEDRHFMMWNSLLPFMDKDSYVSFEDYEARLTGSNIVTKSTNEILKEAEDIEKKILAKGGM